MADNSDRYFARPNNTRGRGSHNRGRNTAYSEYTFEESITIRNMSIPIPPRSSARIGGNNRNRHSTSNSRRSDRNRRFDSNYNRQALLPNPVGNNEINNERPQDNKENQTGGSTRPNNNIENLINRNVTRNVQENRRVNILQSSPHSQPSRELADALTMREACNIVKGPHRNCACLFNLPKRELNLSPTRLNASSTSTINRNQNQRTSNQTDSAPLPKETTQGATSMNFSMANIPSTSRPAEASGSQPRSKETWINAPEFRPKVYTRPAATLTGEQFDKHVCEWIVKYGVCRKVPFCAYTHDGDICDVCNRRVLHPTDIEQRGRHLQDCQARLDRQRDFENKIARSMDKTCGICFDVVVQKDSYERRFGILNQCNHVFCLGCIRKWRQARQFEHKVVKACPECRITSEFVCPSKYWVDTQEEKEELIESYKGVLAEKPCKYFRQGNGNCPFGNKCFYLHALPDGTIADVGPPRRRVTHRRRDDAVIGIDLDQLILWDLNNDLEHHWLYSLAEDVEDLAAFFSDSDDSDGADFDFLF